MAKRNTKETILFESLKLFADKGYDGVTVRDIAAEVGIKMCIRDRNEVEPKWAIRTTCSIGRHCVNKLFSCSYHVSHTFW